MRAQTAHTSCLGTGPTSRARWQLRALLAARRLSDVAHGRGLGRFADRLGRALDPDSYGVFQLPDGRRFQLLLSDGYWIPVVLRGGGYEPEFEALLELLLRPEDAFVDCGANIGWWSAFAARRIHDPSRILAVEAAPQMFAQLRHNAELNDGGFRVEHAAVWNEAGVLSLATDASRHAWSSVSDTVRPGLQDVGFQLVQVPSRTLDQLVADVVPSAGGTRVVKLDVEGAEVQALDGGRETLTDGAIVVYEDHGRDVESAVTRHVMALGLLPHVIDAAGRLHPVRRIEDLVGVKTDRSRGYNLVACTPGTPSAQRLERLTS